MFVLFATVNLVSQRRTLLYINFLLSDQKRIASESFLNNIYLRKPNNA